MKIFSDVLCDNIFIKSNSRAIYLDLIFFIFTVYQSSIRHIMTRLNYGRIFCLESQKIDGNDTIIILNFFYLDFTFFHLKFDFSLLKI